MISREELQGVFENWRLRRGDPSALNEYLTALGEFVLQPPGIFPDMPEPIPPPPRRKTAQQRRKLKPGYAETHEWVYRVRAIGKHHYEFSSITVVGRPGSPEVDKCYEPEVPDAT